MKISLKNIVTTICFAAFVGGGAILCLASPRNEYSVSERRRLAQFPTVSWSSIADASFMSDFETYTLDQFPLRDSWRRLKSAAHYYLFAQRENNGIYIADGSVSKLEYPLNESSVVTAAQKFEYLYEKYFADTGANAYYAVVPDKNYFLAADNGYPAIDYTQMCAILAENLSHLQYIDLFPYLSIDDYYSTDSHWRQECIGDAADALLSGMGITPTAQSYTAHTYEPFYGVYYGQAALPLAPDTLTYLTNDLLDGCTASNYETGATGGIYTLEELAKDDPYEVFLYGAAALVTIENPAAETERELVIFRDSYAASITPLMLYPYAKITLVDIRYVTSDYLARIVDLSTADDVLFLYSTTVLNNSTMLK